MKATTGWTEGKPWEIACGELRGEGAIRKRPEGDGKETMGNSLGMLGDLGESSVGKERDGSAERVDRKETVGNSLKLGESSVGKGRYGNDERVDGKETVGNSLGRAPWGRSEMEATTGWTEGKLWEIAWGELRWEGARWKRMTEWRPWEIASGKVRGEGARWKR